MFSVSFLHFSEKARIWMDGILQVKILLLEHRTMQRSVETRIMTPQTAGHQSQETRQTRLIRLLVPTPLTLRAYGLTRDTRPSMLPQRCSAQVHISSISAFTTQQLLTLHHVMLGTITAHSTSMWCDSGSEDLLPVPSQTSTLWGEAGLPPSLAGRSVVPKHMPAICC